MSGPPPDAGALPQWPPQTAGLLIVAGPHAIPVSTALRSDDRRLIFALSRRRETLARLREEPGAAFAMLAEGMAFTAYGEARVLREELEGISALAAIEFRVERLQDHLADGRTEMLGSADWRWISEKAADADRKVRAEVSALADELAAGT